MKKPVKKDEVRKTLRNNGLKRNSRNWLDYEAAKTIIFGNAHHNNYDELHHEIVLFLGL